MVLEYRASVKLIMSKFKLSFGDIHLNELFASITISIAFHCHFTHSFWTNCQYGFVSLRAFVKHFMNYFFKFTPFSGFLLPSIFKSDRISFKSGCISRSTQGHDCSNSSMLKKTHFKKI